jgi:hypothetical protein
MAASTAVLEGISAADFRRHYGALCNTLVVDNQFGRILFGVAHIIQKVRFSRKAVLKIVAAEQSAPGAPPRMSGILWDTFTGSSPYLDVFWRTLHPAFLSRLIWGLVLSLVNG